MLEQSPIEIVNERLILIERLIEVQEHFKGERDIVHLNEKTYTHRYKQFDALLAYLALTCFDILGQPSEWLEFGAWLQSKNKMDERVLIFEKYKDLSLEQMTVSVYKDYMIVYGVKNSFFRFIHEIISKENRRKLLDSIMVREIHSSAQINDSDEAKEKFLFKARNFFTHKGIAMTGSISKGMITTEKQKKMIMEMKEYLRQRYGKTFVEHSFEPVYRESKGKNIYSYSVANWPHLLIEIIKDTTRHMQN
jgi:hypothetical protein